MPTPTLVRLLISFLLLLAGTSRVSAAEPAKGSESIAGKAAASKAAAARQPARKKYDGLTATPTVPSSAVSLPAPSAAPAFTEKGSHCHASRSDA